jgi:hypothetical protein
MGPERMRLLNRRQASLATNPQSCGCPAKPPANAILHVPERPPCATNHNRPCLKHKRQARQWHGNDLI